ncbi:MAG: Fic family protein [Campylobacterota bacterium]|nr:Fic family protein [Campylobacterota bacterium]
MGYKPPYTITSTILSLVAQISEKLGEMKSFSKKSLMIRKKNRIKTLTGTLQIEGNTLDEKQITAFLDGKSVLGTYKEIEEVKGAVELYDNLEKLDYQKEENLLKAHKLLMQNLLNNAGKYRVSNVGVGGKDGVTHIAPQAELVNKLMCELFEWLSNTKEHPLIVSSVFHYEFEFIHPFVDGNGRIGRFWQSLILYQYKSIFSFIPIESLVRDRQKEYYKALEDSGTLGESTPFIEFMLETILLALEQNDQVSDQVSDQVKKLLDILNDEWLSVNEMMEKLELKHKATFRKNYLNPALELGYIQMKEPNSPRSPKQKYRKVI